MAVSSITGVTVCVEYDDLLAITLPRNARHFRRVLVVTSPQDALTPRVVEKVPNATVYVTDAFYRQGAHFNKGLSLEEGLDVLGRSGWLCIFDADVLMPDKMGGGPLEVGKLYSAHRRLVVHPERWSPDDPWERFPLFGGDGEWGGWFQLFHASDSALAKRPWYGTDWRHAGGCDSDFEAKWSRKNKIWLPFSVLHFGDPGQNWCGRHTPRLDGSLPPDAESRRARQGEIYQARRKLGNFRKERLGEADR